MGRCIEIFIETDGILCATHEYLFRYDLVFRRINSIAKYWAQYSFTFRLDFALSSIKAS